MKYSTSGFLTSWLCFVRTTLLLLEDFAQDIASCLWFRHSCAAVAVESCKELKYAAKAVIL
jgi:hypothetical protein